MSKKSRQLAVAHTKLAKADPGELSLIVFGPLTNLALSLHLEPNLPGLFKELVVVGRAYFSQGTTNIIQQNSISIPIQMKPISYLRVNKSNDGDIGSNIISRNFH